MQEDLGPSSGHLVQHTSARCQSTLEHFCLILIIILTAFPIEYLWTVRLNHLHPSWSNEVSSLQADTCKVIHLKRVLQAGWIHSSNQFSDMPSPCSLVHAAEDQEGPELSKAGCIFPKPHLSSDGVLSQLCLPQDNKALGSLPGARQESLPMKNAEVLDVQERLLEAAAATRIAGALKDSICIIAGILAGIQPAIFPMHQHQLLSIHRMPPKDRKLLRLPVF